MPLLRRQELDFHCRVCKEHLHRPYKVAQTAKIGKVFCPLCLLVMMAMHGLSAASACQGLSCGCALSANQMEEQPCHFDNSLALMIGGYLAQAGSGPSWQLTGKSCCPQMQSVHQCCSICRSLNHHIQQPCWIIIMHSDMTCIVIQCNCDMQVHVVLLRADPSFDVQGSGRGSGSV